MPVQLVAVGAGVNGYKTYYRCPRIISVHYSRVVRILQPRPQGLILDDFPFWKVWQALGTRYMSLRDFSNNTNWESCNLIQEGQSWDRPIISTKSWKMGLTEEQKLKVNLFFCKTCGCRERFQGCRSEILFLTSTALVGASCSKNSLQIYFGE